MAAGPADRPHFPDVGLFRYFILAHRDQARYDRPRTLVTRISREVQVLFFHLSPRKLNPLTVKTALHHTPAAHQVNDQHHQRNHQQQVNQAAGYVEAETKKPQNQKHNENCPKHVDLLRSFDRPRERPRKLIYHVPPVGASDFPHSRQEVLERDVINPQNGHILCDAKTQAGGVTDANSLETDAVIVASRLRKRSRNRRRARSISDPPSFFLRMHAWFRDEATGWSVLEEVSLSASPPNLR
jgi:hypothetical protein